MPNSSQSSASPISLRTIRERLDRHPPARLADSADLRHAAVALILRDSPVGPELLIIGRAEHPDDPWSGHLGFPGGRVEPSDASPERAAVRETEEEIGLALDISARRIGALSELRARARLEVLSMSIFPFVYELVGPISLQPNEEVAMVCWVPLSFFLNPSNRSTMPHPNDPQWVLPCYQLGERLFWGLSLRMLDDLLKDDGRR